jgi:hypothetical protein
MSPLSGMPVASYPNRTNGDPFIEGTLALTLVNSLVRKEPQ